MFIIVHTETCTAIAGKISDRLEDTRLVPVSEALSDPAFGETVKLRLGAQPTLEQSFSTIFRAWAGLPSQTQALNMYSRELRS